MQSSTPTPDPLEALREQEREVETAELWGGNQFSDLFPTLTDDELIQIQEHTQCESVNRCRYSGDD